MTARVSWISLTPVKATMLHLVDEADLRESGSAATGASTSSPSAGGSFSNKDHGPLQLVRAEYDPDADALSLRFADGEVVERRGRSRRRDRDHVPQAAAHGARGRRAVGGRGVGADRASRFGSSSRSCLRRTAAAAARRHCSRPSSLGRLARQLGVDVGRQRRFRMNFGIEGVEAHAEDGWRGRRVRVGDAVVIPQGNVGRCAITTQNPDTGQVDLDTLKGLAGYRSGVETTEPLPFGIHAAVAEPAASGSARPSPCSRPAPVWGRISVAACPIRGLQVGESGVEWSEVDHAAG